MENKLYIIGTSTFYDEERNVACPGKMEVKLTQLAKFFNLTFYVSNPFYKTKLRIFML